MPLSEEAQNAINEAVAIVAEDKLWANISARLAPTVPEPSPEGEPPVPPAGPDNPTPPPPRDDPPPPKVKASAWWGELGDDE